jgi:hypothetical protein
MDGHQPPTSAATRLNNLSSRVGAALRVVCTLSSKLDRDALKALKLHLLECVNAPDLVSSSDEALLAALEVYNSDGDVEKLLLNFDGPLHDVILVRLQSRFRFFGRNSTQAFHSFFYTTPPLPQRSRIGTQIIAHKHPREFSGLPSGSSSSCFSICPSGSVGDFAAPAPPGSPVRITPVGDGSHSRVTGLLSRAALVGDMLSPAPLESKVPVTLCYYAPEFEQVAIELASGSAAVVLHKIRWDKFEDGFPNIFIENVN